MTGPEKLEYLLSFSEELPPLPEWLQERRDNMEPVPECMTPVFIYAERDDGRLNFYFDVPPESPTVRGYAAILQEGVRDVTPEQVLRIPDDFYYRMGLNQVLSSQRINGMMAILAHMKRLATHHLAGPV